MEAFLCTCIPGANPGPSEGCGQRREGVLPAFSCAQGRVGLATLCRGEGLLYPVAVVSGRLVPLCHAK